MPADTTMAVTCSDAAPWLPSLLDGSGSAPPAMVAHSETCLRCQAELVRYRRLLRSLRALRAEQVPPNPEMLSDTLQALEGVRPARRAVWVASIGGVVVAAAASAAGVAVWATRRRVALAS